jgi:hypothetical protein
LKENSTTAAEATNSNFSVTTVTAVIFDFVDVAKVGQKCFKYKQDFTTTTI